MNLVYEVEEILIGCSQFKDVLDAVTGALQRLIMRDTAHTLWLCE
jgi:hypothetical protein